MTENSIQTIANGTANNALPVTALHRYEELVNWARREAQQRHPECAYVTLWASARISSNLARERIKAGRKITASTRYVGYQEIDCSLIAPISQFTFPGRRVILTEAVGAFLFTFQSQQETFDVLYASTYYENDDSPMALAIALVPRAVLEAWATFEALANKAANYLARSRKVYIIGGTGATFEPHLGCDQVILSDSLKSELRTYAETSFT